MDQTEGFRREMVKKINSNPGERATLEAEHGRVWSTEELQKEFEVLNFMAPYIIVKRKSDFVRGSMAFQHLPRFYFDFEPY